MGYDLAGAVCAHILYIAGGTWHVTLLTHDKHLLFLVFSGFFGDDKIRENKSG